MILNQKPLNLAEVKGLVKNLDEKKQMSDYIKKFGNLTKDKADKLSEEIRAFNNVKIREYDLVKIVDFLPTDSEELNKILNEVSLTEEEINAVLEAVKKY